jgi:Kef-type K+ transport system membrane component KefB/nucleotide-binding universal stress UspA family protein
VLYAVTALAVVLFIARAAGEIAKRLGQPEVLGELLAGFLLGPSVLGALLPTVRSTLFLQTPVALVLSGMSWVGAILLLLIAGMEVDLGILRRELKPGIFAAVLAIFPSLIAGSMLAWFVFGRTPPNGVFLGIVLSVTAVSVSAKIFMERGATRRRYAQIILAAGVASEVLVWLFVSVVSSIHSASPLLAGLRSTLFALLFFAVMVTVGRRFVFWTMRRVRDLSTISHGPLTLVLVLTFGAAAVTQALGLHALLGAFVVGVLLSRAPRTNEALVGNVNGLTIGLFAPIFFALAGMRVDVLQLGTVHSIETIAALFVVATVVKVGFGALGARMGGQTLWESWLIGAGLNLKGGTDVVVAVIGTELGLLSTRVYSMYAVVSIVTVLISPPIIAWLEGKAPPSPDETERLEKEEAVRRSYVPTIERVLVPLHPALQPALAAGVVELLAESKQEESQLFDITQFDVCRGNREQTDVVADTQGRLQEIGALGQIEVTERTVVASNELDSILAEAQGYDLIAIGGTPPDPDRPMSVGKMQNAIVQSAPCDVLIALDRETSALEPRDIDRILVPVNGLEYSMAAGDIAAALTQVANARLVVFTVVQSHMDSDHARRRDIRRLERMAQGFLDELAFRVRRLGVEVETKVVSSDDAAGAVLEELRDGDYDLVVMGGYDRGSAGRPYAGKVIRSVVARGSAPSLVLMTHGRTGITATG